MIRRLAESNQARSVDTNVVPDKPRRRWFRFVFSLRTLFAAALLLSVLWLGHAVATGITVPYPDATPEQAAYARFHRAISFPLFGALLIAWLFVAIVAMMAAVYRVCRWVGRRGRPTDRPPQI